MSGLDTSRLLLFDRALVSPLNSNMGEAGFDRFVRLTAAQKGWNV